MGIKLGKKSELHVFRQVLDLIPHMVLCKSIIKHKSDQSCSKYFTYDQLVSMMFGQLKKCLSLRDIDMGNRLLNEVFIPNRS